MPAYAFNIAFHWKRTLRKVKRLSTMSSLQVVQL